MNERIKELLYKAGGEYGGEHPTTGQTVIYTDGVDCEKFAELIVRECAGVNYNSAFKDGEFCAREVLEHFGVEE